MPRLSYKKVALGLAGLGLALQLVRPEKNAGPAEPGPDSLVVRHGAPPEVRRLLEAACNDCHADRTRYPWYAEIQPVGWLLAQHVSDGKRALNLSNFGSLGEKAQSKRLQYMVDAMRDRDMPLKSYLLLHRDARLTEAEINAFASWAESVQAKLAP
jgi:hypothetical protein